MCGDFDFAGFGVHFNYYSDQLDLIKKQSFAILAYIQRGSLAMEASLHSS